MPEKDPKRSGVLASRLLGIYDPQIRLEGGLYFGPPGGMFPATRQDGTRYYLICCPGCGELGAPRDGQSWSVTGGNFDDVHGLTLSPSIQKSCCGWHGHLVNGIFVSC